MLVYKRFIDENVFNATKVCLEVIQKNGSTFDISENQVNKKKKKKNTHRCNILVIFGEFYEKSRF